MTIGILTDHDPFAAALALRLNQRQPGVARLIDWADQKGYLLDQERLQWGDEELTTLSRVLVHRFPYQNPVIPDAGDGRDWSVWRFEYLAEQQLFSTRLSLLQELAQRGVEVINAPGSQINGFMKPAALDRLRELGAPVASMLCTNDAAEATTFRQRHGELLWRPATGKARWQWFTDRQQAALMAPGKPPILLAPTGQGDLCRVFLLGAKPLLAVKQLLPACLPRHETLERFASFDPVAADPLWRTIDLATGSAWVLVTGLKTASGWLLYDLDTDPAPDWLPDPCQDALLSALTAALLDQPLPAPPEEETWMERPGMFLRRMLAILFDFEKSKYRPPDPT